METIVIARTESVIKHIILVNLVDYKIIANNIRGNLGEQNEKNKRKIL